MPLPAAGRGPAPRVRAPCLHTHTLTQPKRRRPSRPAPTALPSDPWRDVVADDDGPTLVPLDVGADSLGGTHDGVFGPLALLLIGFSDADADAVRSVVAEDLGAASILPVLRATRKSLEGTLADALTGVTVDNVAVRERGPLATRADLNGLTAALVSGASPDELQDVVGAVIDGGVGPDLWCAAVPANWSDRSLKQLVQDIAGDAAAAAAREAAGRQ